MTATPTEQAAYKLVDKLSGIDLPTEGSCPPIVDADSLLTAIAHISDRRGRYFASPALLRRITWWQKRLPSSEVVKAWRDELVARRDLRVDPLGLSSYSDSPVDVCTVLRLHRFDRFRPRLPIPSHVRLAIYTRDGFQCVTCGADERLTLDHIHPWSLGGTDDPENLQTMCQSCNSRKGNRI